MDSHEIIPSFQSYPLSSTTSLINIDLKIKSRDTIQGRPYYSLSCYRRPSWQYNYSQNQYGVRITSAWYQIKYPLWPRKVGKNLKYYPSLTASVTISPYNLSSPFKIPKWSVPWLGWKGIIYPGGVRVGILNY